MSPIDDLDLGRDPGSEVHDVVPQAPCGAGVGREEAQAMVAEDHVARQPPLDGLVYKRLGCRKPGLFLCLMVELWGIEPQTS